MDTLKKWFGLTLDISKTDYDTRIEVGMGVGTFAILFSAWLYWLVS